MKQLFKDGFNNFVVDDVPVSEVGDNEVQIEVVNSLISTGTETIGLKSNSGAKLTGKINQQIQNVKKVKDFVSQKGIKELIRKYETRDVISKTTGYSISGIVTAVGSNVYGFKKGDRVAAAGSGIASHAEVVNVPYNLVALAPENVSFEEAAFTTLGSIALQGVRQAQPQAGEIVVVIGLGLLGLITIQILKSSGCKVVGVDLNPKRVKLGIQIGMHYGFVEAENTVVEDILNISNNNGADISIITAASSSNKILNDAMKMTRKKGKVIIVGAIGMQLERSPFYEKEIDLKIACSYGPGRYDRKYEFDGIDYPYAYVRWTENRNMKAFLWMISQKMVDTNSLVTNRFDISDSPDAFKEIINNPSDTLAVMITYANNADPAKLNQTLSIKALSNKSSNKFKLDIAVIGAGSFARNTHLPIIYSDKKFNLKAVATKSGMNAKKIGAEFKAEYATTDYNEILKDSSVDAVIIASRHNLHYRMAMDAIKGGKAILLEKPMGLTFSEIEELDKLVSENQVLFSVGFNRRYSSLSKTVKNLLDKEIGPTIINYRVNAGFVPLDSWIQDRTIGGGRIIGEACHFYDLFNYFIQEEVVSIEADCIPVNSQNIISNDNFVSVIKFKNGSIANLIYTSLGHNTLPKEYIEIFKNGKSIILNDFKELKLFGFNKNNISLKKQDKGFMEQLDQFYKAFKGENSNLLGINEAKTASKISIQVDKLTRPNEN